MKKAPAIFLPNACLSLKAQPIRTPLAASDHSRINICLQSFQPQLKAVYKPDIICQIEPYFPISMLWLYCNLAGIFQPGEQIFQTGE